MDDLLKMDIFFFVTTLSVVVLSCLVAAVLYYVIRLVRTLERIAGEVEEEAKELIKDIDDARKNIKREGVKLAHIAGVAIKAGKRLTTRTRSKKVIT